MGGEDIEELGIKSKLIPTHGILEVNFKKVKDSASELMKGKEIERRVNEFTERGERTAYQVLSAIFNLALNLEGDEKILLALDEEISTPGTSIHIWEVIAAIKALKNDKAWSKILKDIIIISGTGEEIASDAKEYIKDGKDGVKIKKENIIMVTKNTNRKRCGSFVNSATITFVNNNKLEIDEYVPAVELTLFTLAKALNKRNIPGFGTSELIEIYRMMNVKQEDEAILIEKYIERDVITIQLLPAEPIDFQDRVRIYAAIRRILKSA